MGNIFGLPDEGDEEELILGGGTGLERIHVKQASTWDCGIACSTMALRWAAYGNAAKDSKANISINLDPMMNSKSTPLWTIDLYIFLRERGLCLDFSTSLKGVNAEHDSLKWYAGHIDEDRSRVEALFRQIDANGWKVDNAVHTAELADMLKSRDEASLIHWEVAAIVLVNNLYLKADSRRGGSGVPPAVPDYEGHYIFAIGFDYQNNDMLYLDPAKDCEIYRCGLSLFDKARKAPGTDMDLLIIKRNATTT
jgi:hypothetical protein